MFSELMKFMLSIRLFISVLASCQQSYSKNKMLSLSSFQTMSSNRSRKRLNHNPVLAFTDNALNNIISTRSINEIDIFKLR